MENLRHADNFLALFYAAEFDYATINPLVHLPKILPLSQRMYDPATHRGKSLCTSGIWGATEIGKAEVEVESTREISM